MKHVIVIGSSGFLGSAVTRELLAAGYRVFATKHKRPLREVPGMTILDGGIRSLTTGMLNRIDPLAVFHCARPSLPRFRRWGRIIAAWQASRYNSFLVSQMAACNSKPALIFASGSLVYGNSAGPHSEDALLNPVSYARQYHHGEKPIVQAIREEHIQVTMLRFPWIVGEGSWFAWFYLKPLRETKTVPLFGDGGNRMTLISVTDAARMMVRVLTSETGSGIRNVFSPFTLTQGSFAESVARHFSGTVTDSRDIFPRGVEKAVEEAFTSNILMKSDHPELLENYSFQTPEQMLDEMTL